MMLLACILPLAVELYSLTSTIYTFYAVSLHLLHLLKLPHSLLHLLHSISHSRSRSRLVYLCSAPPRCEKRCKAYSAATLRRAPPPQPS